MDTAETAHWNKDGAGWENPAPQSRILCEPFGVSLFLPAGHALPSPAVADALQPDQGPGDVCCHAAPPAARPHS